MSATTRDPPQVPPPPGFGTPTELAEGEVDVELGDECGAERLLDRDTRVEGLTYLGDYPDLESYLRAQLEDQVTAACRWVLDCLDYAAVQRRFERDGSRLVCESGRVYALAGQPATPLQAEASARSDRGGTP
jgi:hypothetical protein